MKSQLFKPHRAVSELSRDELIERLAEQQRQLQQLRQEKSEAIMRESYYAEEAQQARERERLAGWEQMGS